MWRFAAAFSIFSLALIATDETQAQKKKNDGPDRATPAQYALLTKQPYVFGKILSANPAGTSLSFAVENNHYEPVAGGGGNNNNNMKRPSTFRGGKTPAVQQRYQANRNNNRNNLRPGQKGGGNSQQAAMQRMMQQRMQQAQAIQKAQQAMIQQYMQQMMKLQQAQANGQKGGFKLVKDSIEFETPVSEKAVTRRETLPVEYDDKGNLKKFSAEELAKMKGPDKTAPGYMARFEDLTAGTPVRIYFGKDGAETKPVVTKIVIVGEAQLSASPNGKK